MVKHIKEYLPIYLIIITTLVVGTVIYFTNKNVVSNNNEKDYTYTTDLFNELDVAGMLEMFDKKGSYLLFFGRQGCEGCSYQAPYLKIALAKYEFDVYYMDVDKYDLSTDNAIKLKNKLDIEYELYDKKDIFGNFMGYTPMVAIIKDGKQVFGNIGTLKDDEIGELAKRYGVVE